MKWTPKRPTVDGTYWYRERLNPPGTAPRDRVMWWITLCEVLDDMEGDHLVAMFPGREGDRELDGLPGEWSDEAVVVPRPEEPELPDNVVRLKRRWER